MRKITSHRVNPANAQLEIHVHDEPGAGGACHEYEIRIADPLGGSTKEAVRISFQNGPIAEHGVNGITQEALLAICIDRLQGFQAGPFACHYNDIALWKLEEALMWLQKRTRDRMDRGVEGTSIK